MVKINKGSETDSIDSELLVSVMNPHPGCLKDHRTHIFEIQVTRFLKLILQKIDLFKLLSLKILRGFVLRRYFCARKWQRLWDYNINCQRCYIFNGLLKRCY